MIFTGEPTADVMESTVVMDNGDTSSSTDEQHQDNNEDGENEG